MHISVQTRYLQAPYTYAKLTCNIMTHFYSLQGNVHTVKLNNFYESHSIIGCEFCIQSMYKFSSYGSDGGTLHLMLLDYWI
jgi:hypothetical protein